MPDNKANIKKLPKWTMPWQPEHWSEEYGVPKWASTTGKIGGGIGIGAGLLALMLSGAPALGGGANALGLAKFLPKSLGGKVFLGGAGGLSGLSSMEATQTQPPPRVTPGVTSEDLQTLADSFKPKTPPKTGGEQLRPNEFKSYEEALKAAPAGWEPELTEFGTWSFRRAPMKAQKEEMPEGFYKSYKDAAIGAPEGFVPYQTPSGWWGYREADKPENQQITPYQQSQIDYQKRHGEQEEAYRQQQLSFQQQQMGWQKEQEQMQQSQQESKIRSQLMTQPMSWLDPRIYGKGETPVVQPWMMPLSREQYGWKVGESLSGWNPQSGQNMPELATPSAQYWSRMGPTAQQQYMGYQQSQSGIRPEETQFRLRAGSAPSGRYSALRWTR